MPSLKMNGQPIDISCRLSAIVQSSSDAIISKTMDGIITSWNEAAEQIFGYTSDEALGKNILIIIPPEAHEEEKEITTRIKNGEVIEHYETIRVNKKGDRIWIALTVSPIKNKAGNIIGISKISREVSGEKSAEQKQAMLAAIVSSSDDAIISKTLDGIVTSWNDAAQRMFGYTESEAIGRHISLIIPLDRMHEETLIIENIRKGIKTDHFETIRVGKEGKEINISLTISPIRNKNGQIIGASKVARDITEKTEVEKQRQLYTQKLQELNNYRDGFMAMASHELKTPLTIIKASMDILLLQMGEENAKIGFVHRAIKHIEKLDKLISDLLDISKIQAGRLELNTADFDMNILLKEIIQDMQPTTSLQIIFNEKENKLLAHGDIERIGLVIVNLLGNAIKYSPDSRKIFVDAYKDNNKITVSIKDKGIGISQEDITNIFDRFYRVGALTSTFSGSGIGLYISSEIINRHKGKIWAESEINKGSTFYFSIPAGLH